MQPLSQCSLCMWFLLCLFMWPGMKARLKARANMIKACPLSAFKADKDGQTWVRIHTPSPATTTNNTWRSTILKPGCQVSGLHTGFNLSIKLLYLPCHGGGCCCWVCFFLTSLSRPAFWLFVLWNFLPLLTEDGNYFLRGFVISFHSDECCKSLPSIECVIWEKILGFGWCTHTLLVKCVCIKDFIPKCSPSILRKYGTVWKWLSYVYCWCFILEENLQNVLSFIVIHLLVFYVFFLWCSVTVSCSLVALWN